MSTTLSTQRPISALALMAERCNVDPTKLHSTLKNTVFKGATDDELLALVVTANTYELNPLLKELYAFPKKGGGITPMVGIDGWLKIANRQPNFDGLEVEVYGDGKTPTHATCELFLKDRAHSVKITEYFEECKRNTDPWNQMPRRMLRNKAIIQTIRVAFGIGGIVDEDEAEDIGMREAKGRDVNPYEEAPASPSAKLEPKASAPRATRSKPAPAPVDDAIPPQEESRSSFSTARAFFESVKVQSSPATAEKQWKLWRVSYTPAGGEMKEAVTFSKTIGAVIDGLQGGEPILIEVIAGEKGDTIQRLQLANGEEAELSWE